MAKRYYWLRLKHDWFNSKVIKKLRRIAGGDTYTIIYLKMQLLSLKNNGNLYYEGVEEDFIEEMALDLDEDSENVKVTIAFLQKNGLIEMVETDKYLLTDVPALIGSESESAERVRKHRAIKNKKDDVVETLQCNADATESNALVTKSNTEIDIEKEIEKEININNSALSPGKQAQEPEADVAAIILNDGTEWRPTEALFAEYVRLYPRVEVKQQFNEMRSWCLSNPSKRKTKKGVKRFVNGWLAREQDRAPRDSVRRQGNSFKSNGFNEFPQRSYDMGKLESQLLDAGRRKE